MATMFATLFTENKSKVNPLILKSRFLYTAGLTVGAELNSNYQDFNRRQKIKIEVHLLSLTPIPDRRTLMSWVMSLSWEW